MFFFVIYYIFLRISRTQSASQTVIQYNQLEYNQQIGYLDVNLYFFERQQRYLRYFPIDLLSNSS